MTGEEVSEIEYGSRQHPALHLLAPVVAAGAVWAARQSINRAYERVSGRTAPSPSDPQTSWQRAIAWTAATATTAAVIEVSVRRIANQREVIKVLRRGPTPGVVRSVHLEGRPGESLGRLGARLLSAPAADGESGVSGDASQRATLDP
jgi:hypothetical protein